MFNIHKLSGTMPVGFRILVNNIYGRTYATSSQGLKLTLVGAAGRVGQPLALMLKNTPYLDELALYDLCPTKGLCAELSHIDTKCRVISHKGKMEHALRDTKIVVIVASCTEVSDSHFDEMLKPNSAIVFDLIVSCARYCPKAQIVIATNPVNSMVPLACEVLKKFHIFNRNSVVGVTTIDVMRANMIVARSQGVRPEKVHVPIIGGHSDRTTIPVLSRMKPQLEFDRDDLVKITADVQCASENLGRERTCGSLSLSAAFAIARFVISLARAARGEPNIVECTYMRSDLYSNVRYMVTPVLLGQNGVLKNLGIPPLTDYESCQLQNAAEALNHDIRLGESYVTGKTYRASQPEPVDCLDNLDVCNPCT